MKDVVNLFKAGIELNMEDGRLKANLHAEITDDGMDALQDVFDSICKSMAERNRDTIEYREDDEDEDEDLDDDETEEDEDEELDDVSEQVKK